MAVRVGELEVSHSARGIPTYRLELWHTGLNKHRVIKAKDAAIVERKAHVQAEECNQRWAAWLEREAQRNEKARKKNTREAQQQEAASRTLEATEAIEQLEHILRDTLSVDDAVDWDALKDFTAYDTQAEPGSRPGSANVT